MTTHRFTMEPDKLARVLALVAEEADPLGPTDAEHTRFLLEYYFPGEPHQHWLATETPAAIAAALRALGGEEGLKEDRRWLIKERNRLQEELVVAQSAADRLAATLRKFLSSSGHTHGCAVVWRNAPECSPLCIEVRAHFGITDPQNPYGPGVRKPSP